MQNAQVSNPNDFRVVEFHNSEDFTFTPDMGCMYDSRPISGITGAPGINGGESLTLPYHVGRQLATNLAKVAMMRMAPSVDPAGIPTGVPLWDVVKLEAKASSYLTDRYTESKPVAMTETDRLMAKVEELNKIVKDLAAGKTEPVAAPVELPPAAAPIVPPPGSEPLSGPAKAYQDKQEVILSLEKLGIKFDRRQKKEVLEKLLASAQEPALVA